MREGWKKYNMSEVAELKNGKSRPEKVGAYPVYGGNGILGYTDKFNVDNETIIIGRVGAYCGAVYFERNKSWISDNALYAKTHKGFDSKYLFYLLKYKNLNQYAGGSSHPLLTQGRLNELKVEVPPLHTQTRIASILSALDDKIDLNHQTNATLEAIAQAIFKEWFVDFRFPHSPLEGWQAKPDGVDASLRPCPTGGVDSLQAKPAHLSSWQKNSLFPFWALPKNHKLQERAKELRKQGILSEVVFWKAFKDKKKLGWDIDRQVIIGNFIVDFFIPELGLVFEIDGSSHNDKQEYDQERDVFLSSLQLKVVRISDKDVLRNIEGVWSFVTESIKDRVEELEEKSPPRPLGTPQEGNKYKDDGGEMQDSKLGPIPKGWRVIKLEKLIETISETYKFGDKKAIIFLNTSDILEGQVINKKFSDINTLPGQAKKKIRKGDILFSEIRPANKRYAFIDFDAEEYVVSTKLMVLRSKGISPLMVYFYLTSDDVIKQLQHLAETRSGTFPQITFDQIKELEMILPSDDVLIQFVSILETTHQEISNNQHQSATLAAIRDALLPKLMTGEIEV